MKIRNRDFDLDNQVYIMGILNVTPDSFSDGGHFNALDAALKHAEQMIAEGADIIDIGGESTRPSHTPVGEAQEIDRVLPVIEALRARFDVPISIDTYKAKTGELALEAGADLINDVWGFKKEPRLAEVTAAKGVPCCLMHNRTDMNYTDLMTDICADLQASVDIALKAGVKKENIILDPGIGFAKEVEDNFTVMNHLEKLQSLGLPLLLGASRKRFIGLALDLPVEERLEGTVAATVVGVMKGCSIIRVHDVLENKRAALMAKAILRG
ncbi:MAG: dihydropteroate synthase [Eubacterium sp.]|nr:dihydropteroate synthase [Eubacterium sp.]